MKSLFKRIALVAGLVAMSTAANAAICASYVGDLDGLFAGQVLTNTGTCQVGAYTFSNFTIQGVVDAGGNAGTTPFAFAVDQDVIPGGLLFGYSNIFGLDFALTYSVSPGISAMALGTFTATAITEVLCEVPGCGSGANALGTATGGGGPVTIAMPADTLASFVFKDINGGSDFIQVIVPEPVSISLVGFGLLGLGLIGRSRRRK